MTTASIDSFLRRVLTIDAVTCVGVGLLLSLGADLLSPLLEVPRSLASVRGTRLVSNRRICRVGCHGQPAIAVQSASDDHRQPALGRRQCRNAGERLDIFKSFRHCVHRRTSDCSDRVCCTSVHRLAQEAIGSRAAGRNRCRCAWETCQNKRTEITSAIVS